MKQVSSPKRLALSFLVAPLATPLVLGAMVLGFYLVVGVATPFYVPDEVSAATRLFAHYGVVYAYMVALALGVPAVLLYQRHDIRRAPPYLLLGACLGGVPIAVLFIYVTWHSGEPLVSGAPVIAMFTTLGVVCGICSAAFFWCLAFYRRAS
jgi:hypothetical protein